MHSHVAQSIDEVRRIDDAHGVSPVTWLSRLDVLDRVPSMLLVHVMYAGVDDLGRLDPSRHALGYCPYSQHVFGFEARADRWQQAGFRVVAGTDASASNDSMNVQKELRALGAAGTKPVPYSSAYEAFWAAGDRATAEAVAAERDREMIKVNEIIVADRVLDAVWSAPGGLHPGFTAGAIAPGAVAHLAAWRLHHPAFWPRRNPLCDLAFGDTSGALDGLWVNGNPIGRLGAFGSSIIDSDAFRAAEREADERLRRLLDPA